jgi:hypothetical protein
MRKVLLMSAALFGLSAGPLLAQPATPGGSTEAMPGTTGPGSTGMVPGTAAAPNPGGISMGGAGMSGGTGTGMTGMRAMRGQPRQAVGVRRSTPNVRPAMTRASTGRGTGRRAPASVAQDNGVDVPRTGDYRGGVGSPSSSAASNITAADTRSEMAPRLPDPNAGSNSPQAYLAAAQRALASNRTGAAQEALERAETRLLSRSTDPSMANMPDPSASVQAIGAARRALASRDTAAARSAISAAISGMGG